MLRNAGALASAKILFGLSVQALLYTMAADLKALIEPARKLVVLPYVLINHAITNTATFQKGFRSQRMLKNMSIAKSALMGKSTLWGLQKAKML